VGVYYTQYIVPAAGSIRFRPTDQQIEAIVHRLCRLGWIDPDWRSVPLVGIGHVTKAAPRSIAEDVSVLGLLESPVLMGPFPSPPPEAFWGQDRVRPDGLSRAYDFREDPAGVLLPRYNDQVRIVAADEACLVSTNAYSDAWPDQDSCRQCSAELVVDVLDRHAADVERREWFDRAGVGRVVPPECMRCGAAVPFDELGHLPLFQFAVVLDPPTKSTPANEQGAADPELLCALAELTGVPFDMIPCWS
jgi:hypothetical protein